MAPLHFQSRAQPGQVNPVSQPPPACAAAPAMLLEKSLGQNQLGAALAACPRALSDSEHEPSARGCGRPRAAGLLGAYHLRNHGEERSQGNPAQGQTLRAGCRTEGWGTPALGSPSPGV